MSNRLADKNPRRGLLRFALRAPVLLYRIRLGCLLGGRFLLLKHTGRRSGLQRRTVLEVVRHDNESRSYIVCSGWGKASEWYKNLQQNPEAEIEVGCRRIKVGAIRLSQREAEEEMRGYARRHPKAYRWLTATLLGRQAPGEAQELTELAKGIPVIRLRSRRE